MGRGLLRIYLGAAPGVGKTVAMLAEGRRRMERGTDVVVGWVETHGRPHTASQLEGLEVVPRRAVEHRGSLLAELDTAAVIARRPQVVLIDELAHTNVPGSEHAKRWQDVEQILDAGIDVLSTVNIQHLESLNDVVEAITGVRQRETVPDEVVRRAEQVELVDMTPEALRRRMAHGNVYAPEKVDAALANYFRVGNLAALREIALLWLAERVDEALERYRAAEGIRDQWPARERVVVALTGGPESETLLRRGARIASRFAGGDFIACHVRAEEGLAATDPSTLARLRRLAADLGGEFHDVSGHDVAAAILDHARGVNATQVVVGVSRRSRWQAILRPSIASEVADGSGDIDVHLVSHEGSAARTRTRPSGALTGRRVLAGWLLATGGLTALTAGLVAARDGHALSLDLMLYLALTIACALLGGIWPALFCAIAGSLAVNWYFTDPVGTFTINEPPNALALAVFVLVAVAVSSLVHVTARRTEQAVAARRESAALAALSRDLLAEPKPLPVLLERACAALGMDGAVLTGPDAEGHRRVLASTDPDVPVGSPPPADRVWSVEQPVDEGVHLLLSGPPVAAKDQRLVATYAAHAAILLGRERLVSAARDAAGLARDNAARTTLLAAVSHDLRTPLASIKAGVSVLRTPSVRLPPEDRAELLESIEESADRLDSLIGNLLDLSRLETGSLRPHARAVDVLEAVRTTARGVSDPSRIQVVGEPDLPPVRADLGLLDRVLANVLENALRHGDGGPVRVAAERFGDAVQVRVSDHGAGVADADKERIFAAFQRVGDAPQGEGLGLGLAVARGLMTVMDGAVRAEDTPGGGLTLVLELPRADDPAARRADHPADGRRKGEADDPTGAPPRGGHTGATSPGGGHGPALPRLPRGAR